MKSGVYIIRINEFFYIGSSEKLKSRKATHLRQLKAGVHANRFMQRVYKKHQEFHFEILQLAPKEEIISMEQALLDSHIEDINCMNLSSNAKSSFQCERARMATAKANRERVWTNEARVKLSQSMTGRKMREGVMKERSKLFSGSGNPNARLSDSQIENLLEMRKSGVTIKEVAAAFKINRTTVSRICAKAGVSYKPNKWSDAMKAAQKKATERNPKRYSRNVSGTNNPRHKAKNAALIAEYGRIKL